MANKKFSDFTLKTDPADVDFLVGYDGTDNVRIDPDDLGGGGASDLNGLSDCTADTTNNFIGNVPASASGAIQNTSLGIDALNPITSGDFNVGIGYAAGSAITTGSKNTTVGRAALANVSTNSGSTAIGYQAGFISTAGDSVYVGNEPGRANTATGHISIGYQAGYSQTSGASNTNVGYHAGYSNTTNSNRTVIGYEAGYFSTGGYNTFLGYRAAYGSSGSTTGERNVAIGDIALTGLTNGYRNVAIGTNSGQGITSGNQNVVIGDFAGSSLTSGANNVCVGQNAQPSSGTVSNEITLGNSSVTSFRIPGLQSSASNGDVLTYNSSTGNITLQAAGGGGGASDLNGLSDCLVDTESLYVGEVPSSLSSNPQNNTSLGIDASRDLTTATQTTSIGNRAGKQATTGLGNTNLGYQAGSQNQTGIFNTNIGNGAGFWNTASYNVFAGYDSGQVTGGYNTGIGVSALGKAFSSSCIQSVAVGYRAGHQQTAANVVMVGFDAARTNTDNGHTSIGSEAGYSQTSGANNTNLGYRAGYQNTTGFRRTHLGYESGRYNSGSYNTGVGYRACNGFFSFGTGQGTGEHNTAIGNSSMSALNGTSATRNTSVGSLSMGGVLTGADNTTVGYLSGSSVTSGANNTLMGSSAGVNITTGSNHVAIGKNALDAITTASDNIAIGQDALGAATSGRNVAIGKYAQRSMNRGSQFVTQNVAIGYNADANNNNGYYRTNVGSGTGGGDGANVTNIGYNAQASSTSASNEVTLGNSSVTALRCAVTSITSLSDERDKSEIKDLSYGLAFIDALQPREFVWDNRPETKIETDDDGNDTEVEFYSSNKGKKDFGFIAQEVKELDNETLRLVYDENPEKLELSYGKLVPILVQAIKELKEEVELLKSK